MFDGHVYRRHGGNLTAMFGINKKSQGTTATLAIKGMHCVSCSLNIDGALEDLEGVKSSKTNYAKARTVVTHDPAKISVESIMAAIQKLGYEAGVESNPG